jgi:hypothetical protein
MSCHLVWSWRNKEKHNNSFIWPNAPALVAMRNSRNYMLADQAMQVGSNSRRVEQLISWKRIG